MDDGSVVLASKDYRIYVYRYLLGSSTIGINNGNATASSSSSSSSTTPNSSQILAAECLSPTSLNGHAESPTIGSNGY